MSEPPPDGTAERWRRADEILDRALELEGGARAGYLDRACAEDPELRRKVERLLQAAEAEDEFLSPGQVLEGLVEEEPPPGLAPGTVVGRFRILREVGRGGMAVVYRAERADGAFDQQVALKVIQAPPGQADLMRRFRQERQILALLQHPHIAQILDGGTMDDGRLYLVLELVDGRPIDRYCDEERLPLRDRLVLFIKAARAVEHAHRNLVIHRDLKPSNLLVTDDGEPKLLDFGIAKLVAGDAGAATVTGGRLLTPAYASPEQVKGESLTTASDVYQLGLLLYQILSGRWPYRRDESTPVEVAKAILEEEPTRPSAAITGRRRTGHPPGKEDSGPASPEELGAARRTSAERLRKELSGDLDNVVLMALRKEPERRYASVGHLVADVENYLDGRPVSARPATLLYRGGKLLRRHAVAATSAVLLLVLAAVLVVLYTAGLAKERDRARKAAQEAREVSAFLTEILEGVAPTEARGSDVSAREILDRGVDWLETGLAGQPRVQAEMLTRLGGVYAELSLFDDAAPLLERAVTLRRQDASTDPLGLASSLVASARARAGLAEYGVAREQLEEARALREAALPAGDPAIAEVLAGLGDVHRAEGDYEGAKELLNEALELQEKALGPEDPERGRTLHRLARVAWENHDPETSVELLRQALPLLTEGYEEDHPYRVLARADLAEALTAVEEVEEARSVYEEVLPLLEGIYGADHPQVAERLSGYGDLLVDLDDVPKAQEVHRRQLEIFEAAYGPTHPEVGQALNDLGNAYRAEDDLPTARRWYERAAHVWEESLGPRHPRLSIVLRNLAFILERMDEVPQAIALWQRILEIREETFDAEHVALIEPLFKLGRFHLEAGDPAAAEPYLSRTWDLTRKAVPDGHPGRHMPQIAYGRCLALLGRQQQASGLLEPMRPLLPDEDLHPETRRRLLVALETLDQPKEAADARLARTR